MDAPRYCFLSLCRVRGQQGHSPGTSVCVEMEHLGGIAAKKPSKIQVGWSRTCPAGVAWS